MERGLRETKWRRGGAKKKKAHGHFCKGDKAEEEGLGRSAKGWDGCEVGGGKYGSFQYACLANIICIERCGWSFVSQLFAYICIKLIPSQLPLRLFLMQKISQQNEPRPPNKANIWTQMCAAL